jgi:Tol biopolymer transport system component
VHAPQHVRRLTHTAAGKESVFSQWSPDGRSIAFDSDRRGDVQLFVMNQNGGQMRHRVTRRSLDAGHPSWSPDGSRIIFDDKFTQPVGDIFTIRARRAGAQAADVRPGARAGRRSTRLLA